MDVVGMAGSASFADRHLTSSSREVPVSTEVLWSLRMPFWRQAAVPLIRLTVPTLFAALPGGKGRLKSRRLAGGWRAAVSAKISDVRTLSPPVTDENVASEDDLYECVIVGGGITGLCTAQALATRHAKEVGGRILVSESRPRVGGNITTVEGDGYLWEEDPNSFQPNDSMLSMVGREEFVEEYGGKIPLSTALRHLKFNAEESESGGTGRHAILDPALQYANFMWFKGSYNAQIFVSEDEPADSVVRRFRKAVMLAGVIPECRRRRFFETPQDIAKRKLQAAQRRNKSRRFTPRPDAFSGEKKDGGSVSKKGLDDDYWGYTEESS